MHVYNSHYACTSMHAMITLHVATYVRIGGGGHTLDVIIITYNAFFKLTHDTVHGSVSKQGPQTSCTSSLTRQPLRILSELITANPPQNQNVWRIRLLYNICIQPSHYRDCHHSLTAVHTVGRCCSGVHPPTHSLQVHTVGRRCSGVHPPTHSL